MGRIGEVISRTWRTAAKMRELRGPLEGDEEGRDNNRVKVRFSELYLSSSLLRRDLLYSALHLQVHHQPWSACPSLFLLSLASTLHSSSTFAAITHGMSHLIGHVAPGTLADLVLWAPENFGQKPDMIIKGGIIAWAQVRRGLHLDRQ
jgi:urease